MKKIVTTKKKFKTRESIVEKIDKVQAAFKVRCEEAERFGQIADEMFKKYSKQPEKNGYLVEAQENRTNEKKLLKLNKSVPTKLEALKRTLAAFDTQLMPFETDDAVAMQ